jgi:hypothetical protein
MKEPRYRKINIFLDLYRLSREWIQFYFRSFQAPYPTLIKMKTLTSHAIPQMTWIETGTYRGSTTRYLAKRYPKVISIEPSLIFYRYSSSRLKRLLNVELTFGRSEDVFENLLKSTTPEVNIWLDGHYSEGGTYLGDSVSPILSELDTISKNLESFSRIAIFVDDVRLFQKSPSDNSDYPPLNSLIIWCSVNSMRWEIQNDIFIITKQGSLKSGGLI